MIGLKEDLQIKERSYIRMEIDTKGRLVGWVGTAREHTIQRRGIKYRAFLEMEY